MTNFCVHTWKGACPGTALRINGCAQPIQPHPLPSHQPRPCPHPVTRGCCPLPPRLSPETIGLFHQPWRSYSLNGHQQ